MKMLHTFSVLLGTSLMLGGCSRDAGEVAKPTDATSGSAVALPEGIISESASTAPPLREVRRNATVGDTVSFTGYIGGREQPFVKDRAVMLVADIEAAPPCTDGCPVPWDACCTPSDVIIANSATVQVVDASGALLRVGLDGQGPLKAGLEVTVVGKVREVGEKLFVVDATQIAAASQQ